MAGAHDPSLKELIQTVLAGFIRLARGAPDRPKLAEPIDLRAVHLHSEEFFTVSPKGRSRRPDLTAEVPVLDFVKSLDRAEAPS